jgi:hypothetical protein
MMLAGQQVIDENIGIGFPADPQFGFIEGYCLDGQSFVGKNKQRHFSSPFYLSSFIQALMSWHAFAAEAYRWVARLASSRLTIASTQSGMPEATWASGVWA